MACPSPVTAWLLPFLCCCAAAAAVPVRTALIGGPASQDAVRQTAVELADTAVGLSPALRRTPPNTIHEARNADSPESSALSGLSGPVAAEPADGSLSTAAAPVDSALTAARALLEQVRRRDRDSGFEYTADVMIYSQRGDSIVLRGDPARVIHRDARLEAAELVYRRSQHKVVARARRDSSGRLTGMPVLKRGDEALRGQRIVYDVEEEHGTIDHGRMQRDKGFFTGERIHTLSAEEFHVVNGSYTTCDYPEPHFDFYSPRIKVLADEMAIARPVYVRISQHRVLWVPFYVFPLRSDRQSGLLTPSFGRRPVSFGSSQTEWEIRNLGYYLAPNDYWDLTLAADLRQRSGWLARADLAYALRYSLNGNAAIQYERRLSGGQVQRAWRLDLSHNQDLGPDSRIRASGAFQSNKSFSQDNSTSLQDRLNRTLRSNVSYTKRWRDSGNSLNVSASQTRSLDTETATVILPEVRFAKARKALWTGSSKRAEQPGQRPWFSRIYYTGNARLRNRAHETPVDTSRTTQAYASLNASSQHNPLPFLQLSPRLSATWQDDDLRSSGQRVRRTGEAGWSAALTQTFYGLFPTRLWRVIATRHELKPNLSFTYQAARTDTGGIFGFSGDAGSWDQRRKLSLRLDNSFWAKIERGEDEAKIRLARLNLSTGYDFEERNRALSDLTAVLGVAAGSLLDTRVTARYAFYDEADQLQLLAPRLRQIEVNTGCRYAARSSQVAQGRDDQRQAVSFTDSETGTRYGEAPRMDQSAGTSQLQVSHYYSRTRYGYGTSHRSWIRARVGFTLGTAHYRTYSRPRWRFAYSINYNLHAPADPLFSLDRINSELLTVERDFHDWTATLRIEPSSFHRDLAFYFKAQLRDIPQIKLERGDARL